ncbi:DNA gyrase/topoisomerase IV subunit A [Bifidobacterium gallicum]|uniref:DNA topoisomerase (ATP-hydrolyzing) n=1 Tax=Bifidobacterium gallicum DSM 20093 = LMG 11596 TaxID=561180 RepID=D1NRW0_9BIFI|nr:DNA topoisomerase IV subunit A [Bifidobacterium gallicum]EFA23412.1 DNA gyrase/topoisomerase IV, A subunit [Bifidobacterium gallicum DSM 20093 = LMG 11596]KFI57290.1 DNA topoisomerase IV subunit A [Bifidobacterium gallicum DSM 20093 = LMG 11596]
MVSRRKSSPAAYDPRTVKEHIVETPLNEEMSTSFLEYAYSVIYARALPDARDGMKPVQRRIVYQMGQMHLLPNRPYMKSARVVGEVMGKLHPHGDSAIYEAMVRLAQPFAMRLPLVDGHGNFGSLDDGPAASRYTEARLAPAALGMNANIDEDTVDFTPNYDNKLKEPTVLPAAIPNLLVNGASGIAVGMATNMATHNLGEVVAAAKYVMKHPDASLDTLMEYVPGPDWPGGGIIIGRDGIRDAYRDGRGTVTTRATTHMENVTARKKAIVVTELPYMVGPERVLERISEGVKNHKLEGISGAIDLTDRHNGTRIVIEIKTGYDPDAVLVQLLKHTPLQENFTINNVALVDGRPHTLGLRAMLDVWIDHRRNVIRRRSEYRRAKALERLHLVDGLLMALIDIDEVIEVIRTSQDADTAKSRLMQVFDLDDIQAQYILDLRLRRLTKMSRIELETERDDLRRSIAELEGILASAQALDEVVVREMDEAVAAYNTPRRTVLLDTADDGTLHPVSAHGDDTLSASALSAARKAQTLQATAQEVHEASKAKGNDAANMVQALQIEDEPCVIALSASGLIARVPVQALSVLEGRRSDMPRTAHDMVRCAFATTTRSDYALITSAGRLVLAHAVELPSLALATVDGVTNVDLTGGIHAEELIGATQHTDPIDGERVIAAVPMGNANTTARSVNTNDTDNAADSGDTSATADAPTTPAQLAPLALGTRRGLVKRWNREAPTTMDSWSVIDLKDGDEVLAARDAPDGSRLVFVSSDSSLLTFDAKHVRPQGRNSGGMAGIRLAEGCEAIAFSVVEPQELPWIPEEPVEDGTSQPADGIDTVFHATGAVVLTVAGDADALAGTENGSAKITPLSLYPTKGRATGGVRSQRFLKGQNTLVFAYVGQYPLLAATASGAPVTLPEPNLKRDGSGTALDAPLALVG